MTLMYLKKKTTTDENIATKVGNEDAQDSLDLKPGIANVFKFMMEDLGQKELEKSIKSARNAKRGRKPRM